MLPLAASTPPKSNLFPRLRHQYTVRQYVRMLIELWFHGRIRRGRWDGGMEINGNVLFV